MKRYMFNIKKEVRNNFIIDAKDEEIAKKIFQLICDKTDILDRFLDEETNVFADDDPLAVINNLSEFMFGLIRAIGMILFGWGIVQIGLALKTHDPSQRANGFLTVAGGVIITFAKEILTLITGG